MGIGEGEKREKHPCLVKIAVVKGEKEGCIKSPEIYEIFWLFRMNSRFFLPTFWHILQRIGWSIERI